MLVLEPEMLHEKGILRNVPSISLCLGKFIVNQYCCSAESLAGMKRGVGCCVDGSKDLLG